MFQTPPVMNISIIWLLIYLLTQNFSMSFDAYKIKSFTRSQLGSFQYYMSKISPEVISNNIVSKRGKFIEDLSRNIRTRKIDDAIRMLSVYNNSQHAPSNGRSIINYITYVCSEQDRQLYATMLLKSLDKKNFIGLTDYEIIPYLLKCMNCKNIIVGHDTLKVSMSKGLSPTAKSFSILLQGSSHNAFTL